MKDEELRLRVFDALLWRYHRLYVKQCACCGISFSNYGQAFLAGVRWADENPVNKQEQESEK